MLSRQQTGHVTAVAKVCRLPERERVTRFSRHSEPYQRMIRYKAAHTQIGDVRVGPRDDQVKRMTGCMCGLGDVLNAVERQQQLRQLHGVDII